MKKYLIYSDVHFCANSSIVRKRGRLYSARLHNLIDSLSWAEHKADELNCDGIFCLGDFFDRAEITAEEVTALQDVYFSSLPHTFITGNHEANVASLDFSTANIFKSLNAHVVVEPELIEGNKVDLYFIPYITCDTTLDLKDYVKDNGHKKVVLAHSDLAGVQYGKFISKSGFDVDSILNNCTLFINGHLHNACNIKDRIILVGNLTGLNFNENANKYKHYINVLTIADDGSINLEPIINPYAYNFYKLYINTRDDIKILDELDNNSVLSVMCNINIIQEVENKLINLPNVAEYKLIVSYNSDTSTQDEVDFKVEDHVKLFINYVQGKLEPSDILTEELSLLGSN